ncbi:uncharacterized protein MELLADRAFT_107367 [Melampsora larici-populina 98AG31]|uniref:Uncharacterized protein n=1 Tax=Melampsora larici-populina (strain 98AG31 / pathotype 3-4-7) TaxID=747676 RepID=F4RPJ9_MELLP|nr:uncharacterized protein MELLADRAFT_107367 [Melampsora larici-populina 98AG31]EGG05544.1 hypothetical protein MELLADRAFT_107367 [Melampsora larici-populina 98AG31]
MPPKTGESIKKDDQPLEQKKATPDPEELEAYQEYLASKEENTPASPDPEELEAYQAYLDSQVQDVPERRFCSAEPEEVEAVIDYLKSEMGPSLDEHISESGSYDSVKNPEGRLFYTLGDYCRGDVPEDRLRERLLWVQEERKRIRERMRRVEKERDPEGTEAQ